MRRKIISILLVLACITAILSGCSRDRQEALDLMDRYRGEEAALWEYELPEYRPWERWTDLTSEEALEDYDYMWSMLWQNASFLRILDENAEYTGVDTAGLAQSVWKARGEIEGAGVLSRSHFAELVNAGFGELAGYGHLTVLAPGLYFGLCSSLSVAGLGRGSDFLRNYYELLTNRKSTEVYGRWKEVLKEEGYIAAHASTDPPVSISVMENIPYIKVSTFLFSDQDTLEDVCGQLYEFCRENADAEHLIIDIRGNGGGNDLVWMEGFMVPLLGKDVIYTLPQMSLGGPLTRYLRGDMAGFELQEGQGGDGVPEGFRYSGEQKTLYQARGRNVSFKGKVWLLTDGAVGSAADAFAAFCRGTGFATVVGSRTKGGGRGSQPIALPLPNSGICIFFEDIVGLNDDGTCNAYTGTAPDVETEGDALAKCLELIRNGGQP